jgi:hypothetical protein
MLVWQATDSLADGDPTHVVPPAKVAALSAALAGRSTKDAVPYAFFATELGKLAKSVVAAGKELHIILAGCNTIGLVSPLLSATAEADRSGVWVLCTNEVWPSDLAPFLWHHYGALTQKGDLEAFRSATRKLLGEYTEHYKRQRIQDEAVREARAGKPGGLEESLANAAYCDRLDRVEPVPGGTVKMALL